MKTKKATRKQKAAIERHRLNPSLAIVSLVDENPRRAGSLGHKSMRIILSARKPITVDTFVKKGGRLRDLHWDINNKNVKVARKAS